MTFQPWRFVTPGFNIIVNVIVVVVVFFSLDFKTLGCYRDSGNRAIQPLEGKDSLLDGSYYHRKYPIVKCAVAAMRNGYSVFALQNGGWCAASATGIKTYDKYGKSGSCRFDGKGGHWANQVYLADC